MNTPKGTPEEKDEIFERAYKHISNPSEDFEVFDELKLALDDKISCQIDQIKDHYSKPILIVGGHRSLVLGVVAYLWYACTKNQSYDFRLRLKHVEFTGLSEDKVKNRLFRDQSPEPHKIDYTTIDIDADLVHILLYGGLLFVEKLNSKYTDIFESLAVVKRKSEGCGVLVVSTDEEDSLPKDLSQFEVIELEPEKQSKTMGISQDKARKNFVPFPTPPGTQWHEVKISFIDGENVSIRVKDGATIIKNYAEMGFKNRSKPSKLWLLLNKLALSSGSLAGYSDKEKTKESVSDLRKKLNLYFKIEGDPIPYKRRKGYQAVFKLKCSQPPREDDYGGDSNHDMT